MNKIRQANRTAAHRKCEVEGCNGDCVAKGWCSKHYIRWYRHGDPLGGGDPKAEKGSLLKFLMSVVDNPPEDRCAAWIYGKNTYGYGVIKYRGRQVGAHRLSLILYSKSTPLAGIETRHLCGNPACVNPLHLTWGNREENQGDRLMHGTDNRGEKSGQSKLTTDQVITIRLDTRPQRSIGRDYGIDHSTVSRIKHRRAWAHIV